MQRYWVQIMQFFAPLPDNRDQIGVLQQLQMLRHGLAGHIQMRTQHGQRQAIFNMKLIQQLAATWVCQRFENFVYIHTVDL